MEKLNRLIKENPKQGIEKLKSLLDIDFDRNYKLVRKVYEKNKNTKSFIKYFIKSSILEDNFEKMYLDYQKNNGDFLCDILSDYLKQDKYINLEFIRKYTTNEGLLFNQIFLRNSGFKKIKHVESLKKIVYSDEKFIKLSTFLNRVDRELFKKEENIIKELKKIKFLDLLTSVQYYLNMLSMTCQKQKKYVIPKILDTIASNILNYKISLDRKQYEVEEIEFISKIKDTISNMNSMNNEITENLFDFFREKNEFKEIIDNLKFGEYDYEFSKSTILKLFPKDKDDYLEYKKVGEKNAYKDIVLKYAMKDSLKSDFFDSFDSLNKKTAINIKQADFQIMELFGKTVPLNDREIDLKLFPWTILKLSERNERLFGIPLDKKMNKLSFEKAAKKIQFNNSFKMNTWNFLNIRSQKALVSGTVGTLKEQFNEVIEESHITSIFDFFSSDINKKEKIDLVRKPFIKINDKYIWGYSSLKLKDLSKIFTMNAFSNPQLKNNYIQKKSFGFEGDISNLFKEKGFKSSYRITPKKSKEEDIDVVAYKDGYLFLIETKITYFRHDYSSIKIHTENKLKNAEKQLNKRMKNIDKYMENIKNVLGDINIKKIIPLIITNSFEGSSIRENGIFKLSEFELSLYLREESPIALIENINKDKCWNLTGASNPELESGTHEFNDLQIVHYI